MRYLLAFGVSLAVLVAVSAYGHEVNPNMTKEQQDIAKMYSRWMRPQGHYEGIGHRKTSCCNMTDCGVVIESRRSPKGGLDVRVQNPYLTVEQEELWYHVPESIMEINQPDPVESPDGRAHACIIAGEVVCYTAGDGM